MQLNPRENYDYATLVFDAVYSV